MLLRSVLHALLLLSLPQPQGRQAVTAREKQRASVGPELRAPPRLVLEDECFHGLAVDTTVTNQAALARRNEEYFVFLVTGESSQQLAV